MDATLWCNFYGFDVMGDLAFGKSFNMLNDGVAHHYMELMHKATVFGTSFGRFPWAFLLSQHIPIVNIQHNNFLKWLKNQVKKRTEVTYPHTLGCTRLTYCEGGTGATGCI